MLLAFLAYKNVMTLDEFSEWRRWVEATGVHRDEAFELGMALLNIEAEARPSWDCGRAIAPPNSCGRRCGRNHLAL